VKLSSIAALADGHLSPGAFESENAADLAERKSLLGKKGSVVPVRVQEDVDLLISAARIARLCDLYARGDLSIVALAYLADAAQLSERSTFSDESCIDFLAEFTDPEVNGIFTAARAREIAHALAAHT